MRRFVIILPLLVFSAFATATGIYLAPGSSLLPMVAMWTASWLFYLGAIYFFDRVRTGQPAFKQPRLIPFTYHEANALILLVGVALGLRLWQLDQYPFDLHNDEMSCGLEARKFLSTNPPALFGTGWLGHPSLGFFLTSFFLEVAGDSLWGLRISAVAFGMLSIFAAYFLLRVLLGPGVALLTMALTATFHWHLHFSRMGIHNMEASSLSLTAIALFVLALNRGGLFLYALAGVVGGVSVQTYSAAHLTPGLIGFFSISIIIAGKAFFKPVTTGLCVFTLALTITLAPLAKLWINNPSTFNPRLNGMSVLSESNQRHMRSVGINEPLGAGFYQLKRGLGFTILGGDRSGQYGFRGTLLDRFTLPLLIAGMLLAVRKIGHPASQLLLSAVFFTSLFGGVLLLDPPFSPRYLLLGALVMAFPAWFLVWMGTLRASRGWRCVIGLAGAVAVFGSAWINLEYYFFTYREARPGRARDRWIRVLGDHPEVKRVLSTYANPEEVHHESFKFLSPDVVIDWRPPEKFSPAEVNNEIDQVRTPTLIVSPSSGCFRESSECRCLDSNKAVGTCWFIARPRLR